MKKTSLLSALISALTILISAVIDKFMAYYAGSQGLVLVAQFKNVFSITRTFSNGALNDGIVKYSSQLKDSNKLQNYLSIALKITLIFSILSGGILVFFSRSISELVLFSDNYYYFFIALGISLPLIGLYDVIMSTILGLKNISLYFKLSIKTLLLSLVLTVGLTYYFSFVGAVFSIIAQVILGLILVLLYSKKYNKLFSIGSVFEFDKTILKGYSKFFIITMSVMVLSPLILIFQRDVIIDNSNIETAGYWQAMFRIYSVGVVFIQTTMRRYLLPELSSQSSKENISKSIQKTLKLSLFVLLSLLLLFSLLKETIIVVMFSAEFKIIESIFEYTLLVGFIEILGWVYSVWMISKEKYIPFFFSVLIFGITYVLTSMYLVSSYSLNGLVLSLLISKLAQFIFNISYFKLNKG